MSIGRRGRDSGRGALGVTAVLALVLLAMAPALACTAGAGVKVSPGEARPGTAIQVDGVGYRADAGPIDIFWVGATATKVATAYPTASGTFSRQIWVPTGAAPGIYAVRARQLDAARRSYLGDPGTEITVLDAAAGPGSPVLPDPSTDPAPASAPEAAPATDPAPAPAATAPPAATGPAPAASDGATQPAVRPTDDRPAAPATAAAATLPVADESPALPAPAGAPPAAGDPVPAGSGDGLPAVAGSTTPLVVADPGALGRPPTGGAPSTATAVLLGVAALAVFATGAGIVAHDLRRRRAPASRRD